MSQHIALDKMQALVEVRMAIDAAIQVFDPSSSRHEAEVIRHLQNQSRPEVIQAIRWYGASDEFRSIPEVENAPEEMAVGA